MNNVDMGAHSTFARVEVRLDGVKRSVLHHHDHDGRRKNGRQHRILETICEVVGIYDKAKRAFDANGYRSHVRISRRWRSLTTSGDSQYSDPVDLKNAAGLRDDQPEERRRLDEVVQSIERRGLLIDA
jgi:hypothetical protein